MTGRELIIYILENGLEDEQVFENGNFVGFINVLEAAKKFNVGSDTREMWASRKRLRTIKINNTIYIPANCKLEELDE